MLDVSEVDGVRVIRMAAGENRLDDACTVALADAIDPGGTPLVLTGEGKWFCYGLDLDWMGQAGADAATAMMQRLHDVLGRLLAYPGATVAAINGHAFGAGAILAAACDQRVMRADRGFFCLPEVDLGLSMSPEFDAVLQAHLPRPAL